MVPLFVALRLLLDPANLVVDILEYPENLLAFFLEPLNPLPGLTVPIGHLVYEHLDGHDPIQVLAVLVLTAVDAPNEVAALEALLVGADVLEQRGLVGGLTAGEPGVVHLLNI